MNTSFHEEVKKLYQQLIEAWNQRDAKRMSEQFTDQGVQIGFDGSKVIGKEEIYSHLKPIFEDHPTAAYVTKVREIRPLGTDAAFLHAIAGMVPPGKSDLNIDANAHQTLVVVKNDESWQIELFQNTPAQFHGRPELVEEMTEELRQLIK